MAATIGSGCAVSPRKTLVQGSLRAGADRDRARRPRRLAVAQFRHQRLDQGDRRRLHQDDQDGDRADHLLHRGIRHIAYPGRQEGRPHRRQGAGLFRDRFHLRAGDRPYRRQSGTAGRRLRQCAGRRGQGGRICQAGGSAEDRSISSCTSFRTRVVGAFAHRRNPAGAVLFDPVRLCADEPRRARPHHPRPSSTTPHMACSASSPS